MTTFTDKGWILFLGWAPMEAAFFDLDKTVIARASMVAFGKPLYRAGLLSRWLLLRALYGQLVYLYLGADEARMAKMREAALRVTAGWSRDHIRSLVRETLEEVIEPIIYEEALDLIRFHQGEGRKVFIVSASPEEIVDPLAQYLGVDDVIATRPEVDEHGRYSGGVDFYSYGPTKVVAMQEAAERYDLDLGRVVRLLGLHHRRAHALGRGPPGRGQPGPSARPHRGGAGMGGPDLRASREDARPRVDADPRPDGGHQRWPRRNRGRRGRVLAAAP